MKKLFLIILLNIIIFALLFVALDFYIYMRHVKNFDKEWAIPTFKYTFDSGYIIDLSNYFNGKDNFFYGRIPDGMEYKDKSPIVIFGCSYAYGQYLDYNKTFSYKLAQLLKRPVYNRAMSGRGLQNMYIQTTSDYFYKDVPPANDVIYIMLNDHYRRMYINNLTVLDHFNIEHCYKKKGKLVVDDGKNKLRNFVKSLYLYRELNAIYIDKHINNLNNSEQITDDVLEYFIETRKNLEKNWKNKFNFYVILYEPVQYSDILRKKLEQNGFIVVSTFELTTDNLYIKKYFSPKTTHPTEAAWDLLTPKIIKALNL